MYFQKLPFLWQSLKNFMHGGSVPLHSSSRSPALLVSFPELHSVIHPPHFAPPPPSEVAFLRPWLLARWSKANDGKGSIFQIKFYLEIFQNSSEAGYQFKQFKAFLYHRKKCPSFTGKNTENFQIKPLQKSTWNKISVIYSGDSNLFFFFQSFHENFSSWIWSWKYGKETCWQNYF